MASSLFLQLTHRNALECAWGKVSQGGKAAGIDGVRLEKFAFHRERELARLQRELREGTYRPYPARRVRIPKSDGGMRLIGIQAVRDRVAQSSVHQLLQPRIEPLLEESSFAFRPHRSVEMALTAIDTWHQRGYEWAARSDIELCFDSLDQRLLLARLRTVVPENDVLRLIVSWLTAGVIDDADWIESGKGVLQGDVLSPLLCNLYLDSFDEAVTGAGFPLIRYADDFVILGRSQSQAEVGLRHASETLTSLHLEANQHKSWVGSFAQGFEYLGAAMVGDMRLPLIRVDRPGRPPSFTYGYGHRSALFSREVGQQAPSAPEETPLLTTQRALRERMLALLRAERTGRHLSPISAAFLKAWQEAGILPPARKREEWEEWQSIYLI